MRARYVWCNGVSGLTRRASYVRVSKASLLVSGSPINGPVTSSHGGSEAELVYHSPWVLLILRVRTYQPIWSPLYLVGVGCSDLTGCVGPTPAKAYGRVRAVSTPSVDGSGGPDGSATAVSRAG